MHELPVQKVTSIWRVQDKNGVGPYRNRIEESIELLVGHSWGEKQKNHPTPYRDPKIKRRMTDSERCGFNSFWSLIKWFSLRELFLLHRMGFKIKRVNGVLTAIGQHQVLFTPVYSSK
jgi:hypothetical protein